MNIFSVKDTVSKTYIKPFTMLTERDAVEGFKHATNEEGTPYNSFPKDFHLVLLGTFDDRTGKLETIEEKVIISADELIIKKEGN